MATKKRLLFNIGGIAIISIVGATLMMGIDSEGPRLLRFLLYVVIFFAAFSSPAYLSSTFSCSKQSSVLRKRT